MVGFRGVFADCAVRVSDNCLIEGRSPPDGRWNHDGAVPSNASEIATTPSSETSA